MTLTWSSVAFGAGVALMTVAVFVVVLEGEKERVRQHCEIPFNGSYCWGNCEPGLDAAYASAMRGPCAQCYAIGDKRCYEGVKR